MEAYQLTFYLLSWLMLALPSGTYGSELARRAGSSPVVGFLVCLALPALGLLFFLSSRPGEKKILGFGYYCAWMVGISAVLLLAIFFFSARHEAQGGRETFAAFLKSIWPLVVIVLVLTILTIAFAYGLGKGQLLFGGLAVVMQVPFVWFGTEVLVTESYYSDFYGYQNRFANGGAYGISLYAVSLVGYFLAVLAPYGFSFKPTQIQQLPPSSPGVFPPQPGQPPAQPGYPQQGQASGYPPGANTGSPWRRGNGETW